MTKRDKISRELENNYRGIKYGHDLCADRILKICEPDREMIAEEILKDREDVLNYSVKGHVLARSPKDVANEIIRQWREDERGGKE